MLHSLIQQYWNANLIYTNFIIFLNLAGSLLLGTVLGYERAYQGRAAGMRTYGLVCMASCALTVFTGYAHFWFGTGMPSTFTPDPTRVVQGIVSGIGFLCAGVIMKDGFTISGLSTAASIWMCSAIGVLIGVGFYAAAISLTFLAVVGLYVVSIVEAQLPQKKAVVIKLTFKDGFEPNEKKILNQHLTIGLQVSPTGININRKKNVQVWQYIALAAPQQINPSSQDIANLLQSIEGVVEFDIQPSRH